MQQPSFSDYATPAPHYAYSTNYFISMKISQLHDVSYPVIAQVGSVYYTEFSKEIPQFASANIVVYGEVVPSYSDLNGITSCMQEAFDRGMRSAIVKFRHLEEDYCYCYTFSKINLIRNINNFYPAVTSYRHLIHHITSTSDSAESSPFQLGDALDTFCNSGFLSNIKGFSTEVPLHKLSCFLGETWIEDDIFNIMCELTYFRRAIHGHVFSEFEQCSLVLPTTFLINARVAFESNNTDGYTPEILTLRKRMQYADVQVIAMPIVAANHFTAYIYYPSTGKVLFGDSLHHPAPTYSLPLLRWIFSSLGSQYPEISTINTGSIARQSPASGSCGVIAHNFMERMLQGGEEDEYMAQWKESESRTFRDYMLQALILYHHSASTADGEVRDWRRQVILANDFVPEDGAEIQGLLGQVPYTDYIKFVPELEHPVVAHLEDQSKLDLYAKVTRKSFRKMAHVPLVSQLPSLSPQKLQLLPAIKLNEPSPTTPTKKRQRDSFDNNDRSDTSKNIADVTTQFSNLCSPIRNQAKGVKHEAAGPPNIIDLCSPEAKPTNKKLKARHSDSDSDQVEFVSTTKVTRQKDRKKTKVKTERTVIDLSHSPMDVKPVLAKADPDLVLLTSPSFAKTRPPVNVAPGIAKLGAIFTTWEDAQRAVYTREERLGHSWRLGQSKTKDGVKRKITFRCNHYYRHLPVHATNIDPGDFRRGRSVRTDCNAHVNINRVQDTGTWTITTTDWTHNHPPEIPAGGKVRKPPTEEQKAVVTKLATATSHNFTRGQVATVLQMTGDEGKAGLESRQISNIINQARRQARDEVKLDGGDMSAIIKSLQQKMQEAHGWRYEIKLDEQRTVTGIWWQSPEQAELGKRFGDVLINDNTYNRNRANYPLNIGIVIDNHYASRNIWYALHGIEDEAHHSWVLRCHLQSTGYAPYAFGSDRHRSIIASVEATIPTTIHFYCIHHLDGNVGTNVSRLIPSDKWPAFKTAFWEAYRAVSPEHFDERWNALTDKYPQAKKYLDDELYSCRERWAWAFLSHVFTCGVRTNGRVEVENRVNKAIGGPKKSLKQLFDGLNERTAGQTVQELERARDLSRRQHPTQIETVYPGPIALLREYAGPFALQTCFKQMEQSLYYQVEVLQLPDGMHDWHEYSIEVAPMVGYAWENGEEQRMLNRFDNDNAYISTQWLLRLIRGRGLQVEHLLRVTHRGTDAFHMLAILREDKGYICDCAMGMNLGIPCRHYFRALSEMKNMKFSLGVVRARWYQNPTQDLTKIPLVFAREAQTRVRDFVLPEAVPNAGLLLMSNPLQRPNPQARNSSPPPPTQTIPARDVYHTAQTALRPLMAGIQTQEQLDELLEHLEQIKEARRLGAEEGRVHDPLVPNPKGRPREQRLTGPLEGRPRGGGAGGNTSLQREALAGRKCGNCREVGHTRPKCPLLPPP